MINTIAFQNNLQPADVLKIKKSLGLFDHYLVFLGYNKFTRDAIYVVNTLKNGVAKYSETELKLQHPDFKITEIRRFIGNTQDRNQAIGRANHMIGEYYKPFTNNCEHFANYVQEGKSYSKQSDTALIIGAFIGIGLLLRKNN